MQKYDLILFGATGFTGQLVAEYLLKQYGTGKELSWAIAGRSAAKLEQVKTELKAPKLPYIIADSFDETSIYEMVKQSKVICTTVGPYAIYGNLLLKSCVEQGVHYCDLCGEVQWIRKSIDQYHEQAQQTKAKIVHCCGFDSIPSDFGVYFLQKEAQQRLGQALQQIQMRVGDFKGGFSGGTIASLENVVKEARENPKLMKTVIAHPYGLNPKEAKDGLDQPDLRQAAFDEQLKAWIAPFVMGPINTKVVRRSHALLKFPYGKDFQYEEAMYAGKGLAGRIKANVIATFSNALFKPGSPLKRLMSFFLPKPGKGPSRKQIENGHYQFRFYGKTADGKKLMASVHGDKDPGYGSTSKILAETAICLAKDQNPETYGVLTPVTAMEGALLKRLESNAGLTFRIKKGE